MLRFLREELELACAQRQMQIPSDMGLTAKDLQGSRTILALARRLCPAAVHPSAAGNLFL